MLRNTATGWGILTRLLHWTMAVLIIGTLGLGLYMSRVEQDLVNAYLQTQLHKSIGFTVFALALIRILWRLLSPAHPDLPQTMPAWQVRAAKVSHLMLYTLMLMIPVTGWLMASASPLNDPDAFPFQFRNMVFDIFELPDPFASGNQSTTDFLLFLHRSTILLLTVVLAVHAGAALKHHFIDRDNVLRRMITGR